MHKHHLQYCMETSQEAAGQYAFRPYIQDDIAFIQNSWGNSYYKGANYDSLLSPEDFHSFHRPIRERFFLRPTSAAIICCANNDQNLILGWLALERMYNSQSLILHYVYIKEAFKKLGIATDLIKSVTEHLKGPVLHSHITEKAQEIMKHKSKYKRFIYTPHLS